MQGVQLSAIKMTSGLVSFGVWFILTETGIWSSSYAAVSREITLYLELLQEFWSFQIR
jgi:hypothetical protein